MLKLYVINKCQICVLQSSDFKPEVSKLISDSWMIFYVWDKILIFILLFAHTRQVTIVSFLTLFFYFQPYFTVKELNYKCRFPNALNEKVFRDFIGIWQRHVIIIHSCHIFCIGLVRLAWQKILQVKQSFFNSM